MIWISIILGIVEAIPGIIKLIQEILAAIHGQPLGTQLKMEQELRGHLMSIHFGGGPAAVDALHSMGRGLGCLSANPAPAA